MEEEKIISSRKAVVSTCENISRISKMIVSNVESTGKITDHKARLQTLSVRLGAALEEMNTLSKKAISDPSILPKVEGAAANVLAIQTEIYAIL